ncbi:phage portal protein [Methylovirgula ligni]|uniref:Phage portal protein n=2 Tax=Methylovirgula ligni TaxID=569860 RepID=A0A3D9YW50_9HYPH|nr:phage portal protein [Methylovirgula ligni]
MFMSQRGEGQRSWPLSPYEVSVSYGQPGAAGQGADWFGPLAPITPLAPPEVSGRQWDYPSGYNLATTPRIYEPISFHTLRGLAEGYDLLRLVIETRKDQVARLVWNIGPRSKQPGADPRIAALRQFFARPDGLHTFGDWLRLLLEELFVIDAPTLYLQRDRAGRLAALLPLDGATIKPVIDDWGRTPQPYAADGTMIYPVAYQQVLKGYPAVDYSLRDIIYRPRNVRVNRAYGFSPVEQIVTSVNIALRRQMYLLDYFTQGNIPDSLIGVPENWTPDQIASYQKYWDAYFDGDLGRRRRAKFVPGGVAKTFIQTKEPDLKGPFDEWLARIVCFAFSISPQALTQQTNRATAETQKEIAEEEGLAPILAWVKDLIDQIIAQEFDAPDLEFSWSAEPSIDPQAQEAILSSYTAKGIITINEARAALGRDPFPDAAASTPMTLTGGGYVALGQGTDDDVSKSSIVSRIDKSASWDEDQHPRWPAGSGDHHGGRFAPNGKEPASSSGRTALIDDDGCDEEWESAREYCLRLLELHPFHPDRAKLGSHKTVDGCAKGFVSERCGGNPV